MSQACLKSCFRCTLLVVVAIIGTSQVFANENEPEDLSIERPKVTIEIKDPSKQAVCLMRAAGYYSVVVKNFDGLKTRYLFRVPEGKYLVKDANGFVYPLPAGYGAERTELTIPQRTPDAEKEWAWIPAGPTIVGDELGVGAEDEGAPRIEYLSAFWLAKCEVTNEQYTQFLTDQAEFDQRWIDLDSRQCRIHRQAEGEKASNEKANQNNSGPNDNESAPRYSTDAPQLPVVMVSHLGAEAYCQWLTAKTGRTHRLPLEIEWEKAARGPMSSVYSYGDRYRQDGANQESGTIKKVGGYQASEFGLSDMTGNVFEWMANKYDTTKPDDTMNQTLRGGSFVLDGMYLRNSFRMRQSPTVMTDDIGFRVLREALQQEQK